MPKARLADAENLMDMPEDNATPPKPAEAAPATPASSPQTNEELVKSINELKTEVKELRELVNMLLEIVVSMEQDDPGEFEPNVFPQDKFSPYSHFSM